MIPIPALISLASLAAGAFTGGGKDKTPIEQRKLMDAQRGLVGAQTRGTEIENLMSQLKQQRMQSQNPLFEVLQRLAFSRLPWDAKQGMSQPFTGQIGSAMLPPGPMEGGQTRDRGTNPAIGSAVPRPYTY